jgi:subtilisin-like proprotein convertase family protein
MKKYTKLTSSVVALLAGIASQWSNAAPFSFVATDTPLAIPSYGPTVSRINVPSGSGATINDLNVFIDLDHTYVSDLILTIEHVDTGTTATLFNRHGGGDNHINEVTFDDEANVLISNSLAPYGPGSFVPHQALSTFDGESIEGMWALTIDDKMNGDFGTTYSFRIEGDASSPLDGPTTIQVDIKPGSHTNPIKLRSQGVIPVAILTTEDFDANNVDVSTVKFGPGDAQPVHHALDDVDGDTDWDLIFHFKTQEAGTTCGDTEATLTAYTLDGLEITGTDSIKTVGCEKK